MIRKLYYLNTRYYNPKWGRFINVDSYGGQIGGNVLSHNMYLYGLNNPINNSDNNGKFAISLSLAGIKVVGLIIAAVAVVQVTKKPVASFITSVLDNVRYIPPKEKKSTATKTVSKTKAATTTAVQVKAAAIPMSAS